jgi:transcriptional regulator with XRE-family HTH domain
MELKAIVAKNLVDLRKNAGFTQIELAEKLNYSDKAVSKWERGESLPDIETMKRIADLYSVSVDSLLREQKDITKRIYKYALTNGQRMLITLISIGLVWAIATTIFSVLCWINVDELLASYAFIIALPITFIVIIVFNTLWGKVWVNLLAASALLWTTALCVYLLVSFSYKGLCFVLPIPLQIVLIFFYGLKILNLEIRKKRTQAEE